MASERTETQQKKWSHPVPPWEVLFGLDSEREKGADVPRGGLKRQKDRKADGLFFNYSRLDNVSLWEERFRLNILKIFIEYFCIGKRVPLKDLIYNVERMVIIRALSQFEGNQRKTAKFLGIKHTTLNEKVKRYNIRIHKKIF